MTRFFVCGLWLVHGVMATGADFAGIIKSGSDNSRDTRLEEKKTITEGPRRALDVVGISYAGTIDVEDSGTSVESSVACNSWDVPESWSLWRLNLAAGFCYTVQLYPPFRCSSGLDFSVYEGIANGANSGSNNSDPDALTGGVALVEGETDYYANCGPWSSADSKEMKFNTGKLDATGEIMPFTLAVQSSCSTQATEEFVMSIKSTRPCKALLDSCTENSECASNQCTGRPGKPMKCRFCARKQEICSSDGHCCQRRNYPITRRHCDNGQCKKLKKKPLILAYFETYTEDSLGGTTKKRYSFIDTETLKETRIQQELFGPNMEYFGPNMEYEMAYDTNTGTLWTSSWTSSGSDLINSDLIKRDADWTVKEEFTIESGRIVAMEAVEGKLYAVISYREGAVLVTINTANGVPNTVGTVGYHTGITGLAYDGATMYACTNAPSLVTIDMGTGNITSSVSLTTSLDYIDFAPDGVLYGAKSGYGTNALYNLNKVTGEANRIADLSGWIRGFTIAS